MREAAPIRAGSPSWLQARHLSLYLFQQALGGVLVIGAVTLSAILLVDVVEQLRSVGTRAEVSLASALQLTLLRAPLLLEQALPFVVLTGVLFALIRLNRRSELVVMRAAGLSPWALAAPCGALALALGLAAGALLNPLGAGMQRAYETQRSALLGREEATSRQFWFTQTGGRNSQILIRAGSVQPAQSALQDVTVFFFQMDRGRRELRRRLDAPTARLETRALVLEDVVETAPRLGGARHAQVRLPTRLTKAGLTQRGEPGAAAVYDLPRLILEGREAGLQTQRYEIRLNEVLATPLLLLAMALFAVAFSMRLQRLGGLFTWALFGLGAGFAAYFFGEISAALASTGAVPPIAAGWGPPLAALFASFAALATVETLRE